MIKSLFSFAPFPLENEDVQFWTFGLWQLIQSFFFKESAFRTKVGAYPLGSVPTRFGLCIMLYLWDQEFSGGEKLTGPVYSAFQTRPFLLIKMDFLQAVFSS